MIVIPQALSQDQSVCCNQHNYVSGSVRQQVYRPFFRTSLRLSCVDLVQYQSTYVYQLESRNTSHMFSRNQATKVHHVRNALPPKGQADAFAFALALALPFGRGQEAFMKLMIDDFEALFIGFCM